MNFDTFSKSIYKALDKALTKVTSAANLQSYAEDLAEDVQKRTRLGKSVDKPGARPKSMKKLAPSTVKQRKRQTLASTTAPAKSNLTATGAMLKSLSGQSKNREIKVQVGAEEEDKAGWAEASRPFMNIDKAQLKEIEDNLTEELEKFIIKELT